MLEPLKRGAFSDIVDVLEEVLSTEEKKEYNELTEQYSSMRELMEDSITQLKRSQDNNEKVVSPISQHKNDEIEVSYSKAVVVDNLKPSVEKETSCDISRVEPSTTEDALNYTSIDFEPKNSFYINQLPSVKQDNITSDYLLLQDVTRGDDSNEETSFLSVNLRTAHDESSICNHENEVLCTGYISVEIANR